MQVNRNADDVVRRFTRNPRRPVVDTEDICGRCRLINAQRLLRPTGFVLWNDLHQPTHSNCAFCKHLLRRALSTQDNEVYRFPCETAVVRIRSPQRLNSVEIEFLAVKDGASAMITLLSIFADDCDPAHEFLKIPVRKSTGYNSKSKQTLNTARSWLRECLCAHNELREQPKIHSTFRSFF